MRIRLLHSYSGVLTNEKRMAEGEHEVTVELGNYLVDNGHAVAVTPVASELVALEIDEPTVNKPHPFTSKPKGKR